jgi:hypothetical protein
MEWEARTRKACQGSWDLRKERRKVTWTDLSGTHALIHQNQKERGRGPGHAIRVHKMYFNECLLWKDEPIIKTPLVPHQRMMINV